MKIKFWILKLEKSKQSHISILQRNRTKKFCVHAHSYNTHTYTHPKTYRVNCQTGNPGEPVVLFQCKSEGLRVRKASSVVLVQWWSGWRPRKSQCLSSKAGKTSTDQRQPSRRNPLLLRDYQVCFLFPSKLLSGWLRPTHIKESKLSPLV